jgi:hypothetical protein
MGPNGFDGRLAVTWVFGSAHEIADYGVSVLTIKYRSGDGCRVSGVTSDMTHDWHIARRRNADRCHGYGRLLDGLDLRLFDGMCGTVIHEDWCWFQVIPHILWGGS